MITITDPPITKGDWTRDPRAKFRIVGGGDRQVAACGGHTSNVGPEAVEEENEANAVFIAGSKEIAEVMKSFVQVCETGNPMRFMQLVAEHYLSAKHALIKAGYVIRNPEPPLPNDHH